MLSTCSTPNGGGDGGQGNGGNNQQIIRYNNITQVTDLEHRKSYRSTVGVFILLILLLVAGIVFFALQILKNKKKFLENKKKLEELEKFNQEKD